MAFSWVNFGTSFLKEILEKNELNAQQRENLDFALQINEVNILSSIMLSICSEPDISFVKQYRTIIENSLLKSYKEEVLQICKALHITGRTFDEKWQALMKKPTSAGLIDAYISALHHISGIETPLNEYSKFKTTISLRMSETYAEDVPLYPFQKEAVSRLTEHFISNDQNAGILVMPTGSGKSRTASYFLIKEMISRGYQILWIAHRHMLIDQAADCFYQFAGLSKINKPDIKDYRICCISGRHMSIRQVGRAEVIVASIQSVCRSKDHLRRILKRGKVMVVIDECHHTAAPTYQNTIKFIRKCRTNVKLLGLTATPIRANENETSHLYQIFGNSIVYEISMSNLIAKKILADPHFIRVETHSDFEREVTYDEAKFINRFGELPPTLVHKIAVSKERNAVILQQYLSHAEEYGKTLIFTLNVVHCRLLYEELQKKHIRCGLVYSGKEDNTKVISDFKENKLDVLLNVNILTEGSDVPDIQTVFLTRPTSSEGLLMQMIGRGMRGPQAKGTETVNIVDFHDNWNVFQKWLDPQWIIEEELAEETESAAVRKKLDHESYDWRACRALYRAMKADAAALDCTVAVPSGWYTLVDEEGELVRMLVFEDQLSGLKAMMSEKKRWKNNSAFRAQDALERYFSGFGYPPDERELALLIDNIRTLEDPPLLHVLKNRKYADPDYAIQLAEPEQKELPELGRELYETHEIIRDMYASVEEYLEALSRVKQYGKENQLRTRIEELPLEQIPFDTTPYYDIEELYEEVKQERWGGKFDGISSINWTDKPYKTYFGIYYPDNSSIKINMILNSKDVPREAVKFVIYHEMLHRDNRRHDAAFKEQEHRYPNYEELEHFLYGEMLQYDISKM